MMITSEFIIGFVFGVIITGLIGWIWLLYRDWVKARDAFNRPQIVIQPTNRTPAQVQSAAGQAELKIWLLRFVLLAIGWMLIEMMFPGIAALAHDLVWQLWQLLWGG